MHKNKGKKGKLQKRKQSTKKIIQSVQPALETVTEEVEKISISNPEEQPSTSYDDPQPSTSGVIRQVKTKNNDTKEKNDNSQRDTKTADSKETFDENVETTDLSTDQKPLPILLFKEMYDLKLSAKWRKLRKSRIPSILFHRSHETLVIDEEISALKIKYRVGLPTQNFTKYLCSTLQDHTVLTQYFKSKNLPFHTFAEPEKRYVKVVIKGVPPAVIIKKVLNILKEASIPVKRMHKMKVKEMKQKNLMVLAVLHNKPEWKKILKLKSINGHDVTIEPPIVKPLQCHRCQKWGHTRRYCHGIVVCVKCAGEHESKDCPKDESQDVKCANCSQRHTANHKKCNHYPNSSAYKTASQKKAQSMGTRLKAAAARAKANLN